MKKIISFVLDHWKRIALTALLLCLCAWWGGFGDLGVIPGAVSVMLWTC